MEIFYSFDCEPETIFLSVSIMDLFLNRIKTKILKDHLDLICATSIYMASKMEDKIPLFVSNVVSKILHYKYNEYYNSLLFYRSSVIAMEKIIFIEINFNVILTSTYDFIKSYMLDFSNIDMNLIELRIHLEQITRLESISIFMAKLMLHDEAYYEYK